MKLKCNLKVLALGLVSIYGFASCGGGDDDHAHDGEHHQDHKDPKTVVKGGGAEEEPDDHDRDHDHVMAGPNGGRILTKIEPHAEFFVTDDRKVQIAFVDDDLKPIPVAEQTVTAVAGDRANPTELSFTKSGDVLISDVPLPEGNDFPVIVVLKSTPDAKAVREPFNVNLEQCPTCKYKEYACTCEHDH